jgi:Bacterial archaeo-eukaryotic release factor family 3
VESLHHPDLAELLAGHEPPCLSLYQTTHRTHPENQQDPIRFKNLVKALEESLRQKYPTRDVRSLLVLFDHLLDDAIFWRHTLDGLAVFGGHGFFRAFKLLRPVGEAAVAADSFHTKPLVRILQTADRYQVLGLSKKSFRMFEGNRDVLHEIHPSQAVEESVKDALRTDHPEPQRGVVSQGSAGSIQFGGRSGKEEADITIERFFRAVDRAVIEHYSKPSGLPLIVAALGENQSPFRSVSHNSQLLAKGVDVNPEGIPADDLRQRVWHVVERDYLERLAKWTEEFGLAQSKWLGTGDVSSIADAAFAGRVATLLVEADRKIPGKIDPETGRISPEALCDPAVDDLLDDLAELVLKKGGLVAVVPADRMPTKSGAAAIFRY